MAKKDRNIFDLPEEYPLGTTMDMLAEFIPSNTTFGLHNVATSSDTVTFVFGSTYSKYDIVISFVKKAGG